MRSSIPVVAFFIALSGSPAVSAPVKVDRAAARLPAGFTGTEAEAFFWSLPGAREGEAGEIPKQLAGTHAFRIKLSGPAGPGSACEWMAATKENAVTLRVPAAAATGSFCLAFTRQTRTRPITSPSGETVQTQEIYEKLFSVKASEPGELEAIQKTLAIGDLAITLERSSAVDAAKVLAGLGAVLVADVSGTPDFEMSGEEAQPGKSDKSLRRNNYLIPAAGIEIWLFDKKSGEVLLKKALHP